MNGDHDPNSPGAERPGTVASEPLSSARLTEYLVGTLGPDESGDIERRAAADPELRKTFEWLRASFRPRQIPQDFVDVEAALSVVTRRLGFGDRIGERSLETGVHAPQVPTSDVRPAATIRSGRVQPEGRVPRFTSFRQTNVRAAWGAIVGSVAAILFVTSWARTRSGPLTPARTYATRRAEQAVVQLSDGTRITLGPLTTLTVARGFGTARRELRLDGEAYFAVTRAAGHPFIVRAAGVTTRVLGTEFDVRHYPGDHDVRVAVLSGKVATAARARTSRAPLVLTPGMVARVADSTVAVTQGTDLREYTEWTSGRLVFKKARAAEVLTTLARWYGLEFRLADPTLANKYVTMVVDRDARADMLRTVGLVLEVQMAFQGNVVTLTPAVQDGAARTRHEADDAFTTRKEAGR